MQTFGGARQSEAGAIGTSGVERPHVGWWISIGFGMGLLGVLAWSDAAYAAWTEHVTTVFTRGFLRPLFAGACAIHVFEAQVALRVARRAGIEPAAGWWFQTLLLGFPSLRLLLRRAR